MILIADYFIYQLDDKDYKKYVANVNLIDGVVRINDTDYDDTGRPELVFDIFGETLTIQLDNYKFEHKKLQGFHTTELSETDKKNLDKTIEKYSEILK